jgi:hypothetical protein
LCELFVVGALANEKILAVVHGTNEKILAVVHGTCEKLSAVVHGTRVRQVQFCSSLRVHLNRLDLTQKLQVLLQAAGRLIFGHKICVNKD